MRTKSYHALGLPPNSSEQAIKKAYRKLAFQFHPDKNPNPEAKKRFIEITHAYEYLLRNVEIPNDSSYSAPFEEQLKTEAYQKEQERFRVLKEERLKKMRYAQFRKEQIKQQNEQEERRFFRKLTTGYRWFLFRLFAYVLSIISVLSVIDYNLPSNIVSYHVKDIKDSYGGLTEVLVSEIKLDDGRTVMMSSYRNYLPPVNSRVLIEESPIFRTTRYVSGYRDISWYFRNPTDFNEFSLFPFFQLLMLVPLFVVFYKKQDLNFNIMYHLSTFFIYPLVLIYMMYRI